VLDPKDTSIIEARPLRGMDQRWSPSREFAARIRDMRWNPKDGWQDAGGFRNLTNNYDEVQGEATVSVNSYDSESRITSLHWFAQHSGVVQWLLYTTESGRWSYFNGSLAPDGNHSDIYYIDGDLFNGTARSIASVDGVWWGPQYQTWGNLCYMVTGASDALVFDGRKADRAGFLSPPPPPSGYAANKNVSTGSITNQTESDTIGLGKYDTASGVRYKVAFLNDRGQLSPLSVASGMVTFTNAAGSRHFLTVDVPTGDESVVGRVVYRTQDILDADGYPLALSGGENFYYLTTILDNVTRIFMDVKPDAQLGAAVDELDFGPWPTNATLLCTFKNTMFVATATYGGVYYSAPGMPEVFPPDNRFPLSDGVGGSPTCLYPTKNAVVVFKERGIYLIKGDPVNGFYSQTLTLNDGAGGPGCVSEIPGLGVAFIGTGGIKLLEGALENTGTTTRVVNLGTQLPDEWERVNTSALANVRSAVYHADKEWWVAIPTLSETYPTRVLVYHYEIGAWSYRENYPIGAIIETADHRGYLIFGSSNTASTPGLHVYSPGWSDKGGVWDIEPLYETVHINFASLWRAVEAHRIGIYCVGYGENDIRATYTVNRGMEVSFDAARSESGNAYLLHDQMYPLDDGAVDPSDSSVSMMPRYDSAVLGSTGVVAVTWTWAEHRPVVVWWNFSTMNDGPMSELQLAFTPAGRRVQILGWELEVKGERRIVPLTDNFGGGSV